MERLISLWFIGSSAAVLTLHPKGASWCSMELDLQGQLADRAYPILASLECKEWGTLHIGTNRRTQ